jgi:hypothetical protein
MSLPGDQVRGLVLSEPDKRLVNVGLDVNVDSDRPIALDEVVSRGIPVHWDEAVATIEGLCELLVSPRTELPVPALQDILIGADGVVSAPYTGRGERGPVEAGRALHTLLSTGDVPMALRLFVTQATTPETHESIGEFAAALSYFGKPTRQALVRALYDRCLAASGVVGATDTPPLPGVRDGQAPKAPEARPSKQRPRWVVPAGVTVCLLGVAAWLWVSGVASGISGELFSGLLSQTKDVIADLRPASEPPAAIAEPTIATPTSTLRTTAGARRPSVATRAASEAVELPPPSVVPDPLALVALPIPDAPLPAPLAAVDIPAQPEVVRALYSSADPDVSPPVFLFPSWTAPLILGANGEPLDRMEIVVSATGEVERVRLVNGPTRMPDMMLLSAAKSWRFRPALKDGEPVRYRTTASWTGFP